MLNFINIDNQREKFLDWVDVQQTDKRTDGHDENIKVPHYKNTSNSVFHQNISLFFCIFCENYQGYFKGKVLQFLQNI